MWFFYGGTYGERAKNGGFLMGYKEKVIGV